MRCSYYRFDCDDINSYLVDKSEFDDTNTCASTNRYLNMITGVARKLLVQKGM